MSLLGSRGAIISDMGIKTCLRCREAKPTTEFGRHARRKDGLRSWCRLCNNASTRAYCSHPDRAAALLADQRAHRARAKSNWVESAKRPDFVAKFWGLVAIADPESCWPWTGKLDREGYGRPAVDRVGIYAHRIAYALTHGDPGRLHVLHSCDNPACCNPAHLSAGSHAENMAQMAERGRAGGTIPATTVRAICDALASGERGASIARRFGVSQATVSVIKTTMARTNAA